MSKVRVVLLGVLAACALSATAMATQASAHEYLVEGKPVATGTHIKFKGKALATAPNGWLLLATIFTIKVHIRCTHIKFAGGILPIGISKAQFTFTNCTVLEPANCTVKEPIATNQVKGELVNTPVEDAFTPEGTTEFAKITLEGANCGVSGTGTVEGKQTCKLPSAGTELVVHEVLCETSGSALKFFGAAATFGGPAVNVELETKQKWSGS
jgi:hypothetical protein